MEHFAGADLHKRVTQLALLRKGKPAAQFRFRNERRAVEKILGGIPAGTKIAVEATGSWWWFVGKARELGHEVFLSHPKRTKAIASARLKSDKVDASMLGRLLKADLLPTVWIPGERERYVRELLSHRGRVNRARTAVINELHAVYSKRNIELRGVVWLRAEPKALRVKELTGYAVRIVQENVSLLQFLNEQLKGLDRELKVIAMEDPQARRLMSIPGVGPVTAVAMSCLVGDIKRFASAKKLVSYFGIAPRVRESAGRERHGHISKEGNRMVRWLSVQAALSHIRCSRGGARRHYVGVCHRRGKKIARVAATRKLLGVMYQLMKEKIDYEEFLRCGSSAQ